MRLRGDRFDHNLHALRLVESFENRYVRFPGLNLTFEVREGIVKHSHDLAPDASGELAEYLPALRPPLESQLIDLCDEIAYNTSDLDDALSAQLLDVATLRREVPEFDELYDTLESQYPGAPERVRLNEVIRGLVNWLVSGLIEGTRAAAEGLESVDDVRRHPRRIACYSAESASTNAQLKKILRREVYLSELVTAERKASTARVEQLFEYLMAHPALLPEGYVEDSPSLQRAVCDYIAGMTDGYFDRIYQEVFAG